MDALGGVPRSSAIWPHAVQVKPDTRFRANEYDDPIFCSFPTNLPRGLPVTPDKISQFLRGAQLGQYLCSSDTGCARLGTRNYDCYDDDFGFMIMHASIPRACTLELLRAGNCLRPGNNQRLTLRRRDMISFVVCFWTALSSLSKFLSINIPVKPNVSN